MCRLQRRNATPAQQPGTPGVEVMLVSLVIPSPSMEGIALLNESGSQANEDRIGSTSGSRIGGLSSAHSVAFQRLG
jgi:hypothetical protein